MDLKGEKLNELALFAGAGGGILGGLLCGFRTICAVEIEEYPRAVLLQRQNDGILDPFPVWDDVRTFDGKPWRGHIDIVTGGFPCQDISAAGKGAGITGERSGLWKEFARIIGEVRPRYALLENSPMLINRGLDVVLSDLAALGYDAKWGIVSAENAGAPHKRERIWVVADAHQDGRFCGRVVRDEHSPQRGREGKAERSAHRERAEVPPTNKKLVDQWVSPPGIDGMADVVACQVDRLAAIGNGQVPLCAALAWKLLSGMA